MSRLRAQLLRIQRDNYEKSLKLVRLSLSPSRQVQRYEREYKRYLKSFQLISSKNEMIKKVLASDVVYHGDYHTLRHSQRSILAMLQEIAGKREIVLCLEMFHGQDQKYVDLYMEGRLDEKLFLQKIGYVRKWAYNWNPWRDVLQLCRARNIPVLGINSDSSDPDHSLLERDVYASKIIGKAIIRYPGKIVYVVDGDYHISPNHLPRQVEVRLRAFDVETRRVIIYQNAENLYWKLAEDRKEEADVLQIGTDSFCLMNTMPATKLQSYLNWLEFAEDGYFPVKGNWAELSGDNYFFSLQSIVHNLDSVFQFPFPMEAFERLTVYSSRNLDFMEVIQGTPELCGHLRSIKEKLRRDEGFLLEYLAAGVPHFIIYLPNSSINMAAEEATHFMNVVLRGPLQRRLGDFDRFYVNAITESLGFFGSKLINEKRKPPSETPLRQLVSRHKQEKVSFLDARNVQVARLLLQHLHLERTHGSETGFRKKFTDIYAENSSIPQAFSTQLGYMLGNRLYYAVKKDVFPLSEIRALFFEGFQETGKAFALYMTLTQRVRMTRSLLKEQIKITGRIAAHG